MTSLPSRFPAPLYRPGTSVGYVSCGELVLTTVTRSVLRKAFHKPDQPWEWVYTVPGLRNGIEFAEADLMPVGPDEGDLKRPLHAFRTKMESNQP